LLQNWCLGLKSMVILMNFLKRMEWRKTDERIGIAVLRFRWTGFEGYGKCDTALSFIFWVWKHTPAPLKRGEV
jgi:hypothetical protein